MRKIFIIMSFMASTIYGDSGTDTFKNKQGMRFSKLKEISTFHQNIYGNQKGLKFHIREVYGDKTTQLIFETKCNNWELSLIDGQQRYKPWRYSALGDCCSGSPASVYVTDFNNDGFKDYLIIVSWLGPCGPPPTTPVILIISNENGAPIAIKFSSFMFDFDDLSTEGNKLTITKQKLLSRKITNKETVYSSLIRKYTIELSKGLTIKELKKSASSITNRYRNSTGSSSVIQAKFKQENIDSSEYLFQIHRYVEKTRGNTCSGLKQMYFKK